MITVFKDLFVYVPKGSGKTFIKGYASTDLYLLKVSFVEDTGEIWTNGKPFGASVESINTLKESITALGELFNTDLTNSIELEILDRNAAIEALRNEILGDATKLKETLDSLSEIDEWIETHGSAFEDIKNAIEELETKISDETIRATTEEQTLKALIEEVANTPIWMSFEVDPDTPEITEDTMVFSSAESIVEELSKEGADSLNMDAVIATNDSMEFFEKAENSAVVFKNITL